MWLRLTIPRLKRIAVSRKKFHMMKVSLLSGSCKENTTCFACSSCVLMFSQFVESYHSVSWTVPHVWILWKEVEVGDTSEIERQKNYRKHCLVCDFTNCDTRCVRVRVRVHVHVYECCVHVHVYLPIYVCICVCECVRVRVRLLEGKECNKYFRANSNSQSNWIRFRSSQDTEYKSQLQRYFVGGWVGTIK